MCLFRASVWYGMCVSRDCLTKFGEMKKENYLQPEVGVTEIRAERGFAGSTVTGGVEGFDREDWNE